MFRILRYFSLASLATFLLAAVLLAAYYREVAIQGIVQLGKQSNSALAQTALNSVRDPLLEYLTEASGAPRKHLPLSAKLDRVIQNMMNGTTVVRVTIFNQQGRVLFSTKAEQIGQDEQSNEGFAAAIRGNAHSRLIYHDRFTLDPVTEDDNLIQTYLPVRRTPTTAVLGVFEIYTDVNPLVLATEHTQLIIMAGGAAILLLLYAALLMIVHRAGRVIDGQQNIIQERTRVLELLSAHLFTAQENERKRIAGGLHEGLAQMLSAIKMKYENALHQIKHSGASFEPKPLEDVLHALQGAIQNVRALAMELRPPSLDELGLIDTLDWFFREFREANPGVGVESAINLEEPAVPPHLKTIVYRIVQEVFEYMVRQRQTNLIHLALADIRDQISLTISDNGLPYRFGGPVRSSDDVLAATKERVVLSGGNFAVETTPWGATTVRASWPLPRSEIRYIA
jgi:signal transduction histidine kinase